MEPFVTYFLKVNGLLVVFYLSYYFLLCKETFFQSNRWFLLLGILSSLLLPLLTFTEIVWIESDPMVYDSLPSIPFESNNNTTEETSFNWSIAIISIYSLISIVFLSKLIAELISFFRIIQKGNKSKNEKIIFIETSENQNPFSFFNYLVFNKVNFTEEELHLILIHEKVHIQQKHSIDVLVSKFLCLVLWINPIVWLYRKAILENLEFIADSETSKISNKTYEYQKTLVKAVVCNNQLSITNQFYQSLIKKRIVMLNTNPSHRKNVWKYSIVIPALIAFVFLFQIKSVAQVRETEFASAYVVEVVQFLITKHTTDAEIKSETDLLKKEHGINLKISKIKRNSSNEIIGLSMSYKDKEGNTGQLSKKSDAPIEPILFYKELDKNGKIGFGDQQMTAFATGIAWDQAVQNLETVDIKSEDGEDIYIINGKQFSNQELKDKIVTVDGSIDSKEDTKTNKRIIVFNGNSTISDKEPKTIIFLNDNEISKEEMDNLDPEIIKSVNVNKGNLKREIKIITKNSASIPEDAEIYINGKKVSKEELDELETSEIALMNIRKENSKNRIEIETIKTSTTFQPIPEEIEKRITSEMIEMKAELAKERAELAKSRAELAKKKEPKIIETADGDQSILFNGNMLKIPGEPTIKITNEKVVIYVNGKKLSNSEAFLTMDHSKIYYLEVTDKETLENNVIKVKRIDVKTK